MLGKGWKTLSDALTSYKHAEKIIRTEPDKVLRLPSTPEDPAWGDIWGRLGRPETPEGYDFGDLKPGELDLVTPFREVAHRLGIPQPMARGMVEWFDQAIQEAVEAQEAQAEQEARLARDQSHAALRKKYGAAFPEAELTHRAALAHFEVSNEFLQKAIAGGVTHEELFDLFVKIGTAVGEHRTPAGGGSTASFPGSPEWAKREIAKIEGDKAFMTAYHKGEDWAVKRRKELFDQAYPSP
jgi:hypothetical protein